MICYKCHREIDVTMVSRNTECPECHTDLHCCKACRFFSPGDHYDCKEPSAENVLDKEKGNFCEWFQIKLVGRSVPVADNSDFQKAKEAKAAFNALFGD